MLTTGLYDVVGQVRRGDASDRSVAKSRPRLLVVHHTGLEVPGGAEKVTRRMVGAWRNLGAQVTVWTFDDLPSAIPPRMRRLLFPYLVFWRLVVRHRAGDFDLIDAATGDTWLYQTLVRRRLPVVIRSHGLEPLGERAIRRHARLSGAQLGLLRDLYYRWWMPWEVRQSIRRADLVRVLNSAEHTYCVRELAVPAQRVLLRPNGCDGARSTEPCSNGSPTSIAAIGRWEPMKGSADLAQAAVTVMRRRPEVRLTLLGTGESSEAVMADFPVELRDRITVVPSFDADAVSRHLEGHGLYVSASHSEGFSLALVEAMAAGLVPVVSRVGAAPDLLKGDDCGATFTAGDVDALTHALIRLIEQPDVVAEMAGRARRRVVTLSWESIAEEDLALYVERLTGVAQRRSGRGLLLGLRGPG